MNDRAALQEQRRISNYWKGQGVSNYGANALAKAGVDQETAASISEWDLRRIPGVGKATIQQMFEPRPKPQTADAVLLVRSLAEVPTEDLLAEIRRRIEGKIAA